MEKKETEEKRIKKDEAVFAGVKRNNDNPLKGRCSGCGGTVFFGVKLIA